MCREMNEHLNDSCRPDSPQGWNPQGCLGPSLNYRITLVMLGSSKYLSQIQANIFPKYGIYC